MRSFTVARPAIRLEVIDRLEVGRGLTLLEVRVDSHEGGTWGEEIQTLAGVQEVEWIDGTEGSEVYRVLFRGRMFLPLLKKLKLLRHFPFPIQDGVATWTVVGPESKVRALLENLESSGVAFHVDSVHHGSLTRMPSSLTLRQKEILSRALAEGYFDVPRRITLTKLAPKIGVAISTLSVTLAIIEKKIIEPHGGAPDDPGRI